MQLFFLCYVKASFFSTVIFCLRVTGYNFMGSNSVNFIFPASLTMAVSKGKNLLPYELILSLTSCVVLKPVKMAETYGSGCTHTE